MKEKETAIDIPYQSEELESKLLILGGEDSGNINCRESETKSEIRKFCISRNSFVKIENKLSKSGRSR